MTNCRQFPSAVKNSHKVISAPYPPQIITLKNPLLLSAIHLAAVTDVQNVNQQPLSDDGIDDPVGPDPVGTVPLEMPLEGLALKGILLKEFERRVNPGEEFSIMLEKPTIDGFSSPRKLDAIHA